MCNLLNIFPQGNGPLHLLTCNSLLMNAANLSICFLKEVLSDLLSDGNQDLTTTGIALVCWKPFFVLWYAICIFLCCCLLFFNMEMVKKVVVQSILHCHTWGAKSCHVHKIALPWLSCSFLSKVIYICMYISAGCFQLAHALLRLFV